MLFYKIGKIKKKMKNYLLSFLYCFLYLSITLLGFWGLSCVLDAQTYRIVLMTCLAVGLGMSFFLNLWFRQDELFFLLFLTLLTYLFLGYACFILSMFTFYFKRIPMILLFIHSVKSFLSYFVKLPSFIFSLILFRHCLELRFLWRLKNKLEAY